jgi:hypothetical protein
MKNFVKIIDTVSPILKHKIKPKICIECKYYTKDSFFTFSEFGKCSLFPSEEYTGYFLVNGKKPNKEYYYCYTSREFDNMCGKEGKFYEKK